MAVLRHIVHAGGQHLFRGKAGDVLPVQNGLAAQRPVAPENGGGKLGAARAHHAGDAQYLAGVHLQINVRKAVAGKLLQLKHRLEVFVINGDGAALFLLHLIHVRGQKALHQHLAGEVRHGALQRHNAVAQDGNMRGQLEHLGQAVCNVNNADALFAQIVHAFEQAFHFLKGKGAGGLVQNEHLRIAQKPAQYLYKLLLGNGKAGGLAVQIQMPANLVHLLHKAPAQLCRLFRKADEDIFLHRHVREQHGLLRHHIDARRQGHRGAREVQLFPFDINVALVLLIDAHDNFHQRAFARAVSADEGQHLARAHRKVDALQNGVQAERFADALYREQRRAAGLCTLLRHLSFSLPKKVDKSY